jgi:hypothetical protein
MSGVSGLREHCFSMPGKVTRVPENNDWLHLIKKKKKETPYI